MPEFESNERWMPIKGFEGLYSVSDLGRYRSDRTHGLSHPGLILTPNKDHCGYHQAQLFDGHGKRSQPLLHRLVFSSFARAIPQGTEINHINGVKSDNRLVNLEVVTSAQNKHHARTRLGIVPGRVGSKHHMAKLQEADVAEIRRLLANGQKRVALAVAFGVRVSLIGKIARRETWRHVP